MKWLGVVSAPSNFKPITEKNSDYLNFIVKFIFVDLLIFFSKQHKSEQQLGKIP